MTLASASDPPPHSSSDPQRLLDDLRGLVVDISSSKKSVQNDEIFRNLNMSQWKKVKELVQTIDIGLFRQHPPVISKEEKDEFRPESFFRDQYEVKFKRNPPHRNTFRNKLIEVCHELKVTYKTNGVSSKKGIRFFSQELMRRDFFVTH